METLALTVAQILLDTGGEVPSLDFLQGQSPWLILAVILIAAAAFVLRGAVKRSGDTGEGKEGLASADAAADYLARRAAEERDLRIAAEKKCTDKELELANALTRLRECEESMSQLTPGDGS